MTESCEASSPSAMRSIASIFEHAVAVFSLQGFPGLKRLARPSPHVIATEAGKDLDLIGRKAPQVAVLDQIGGVSGVPVAADVLADVVQERP